MSIHVRFLGLEGPFARDLTFAPLDDTPSLLRLLGDALAGLQGAIDQRRWQPKRNPPLSVAVTLGALQPVGAVSQTLLPDVRRSQGISAALDGINRRYGNNAVYFGAMQAAIAQDAAPMRIPFSKIPDTAFEEDALCGTWHRRLGPSMKVDSIPPRS